MIQMGCNKNNSSTKMVRNLDRSVRNGKEPSKQPVLAETNVSTRTRSKRSNESLGSDEQPLPKHKKSDSKQSNKTKKPTAKAVIARNIEKVNSSKKGKSVLQVAETGPVVGSAKSLIRSIKNGNLEKQSRQVEKDQMVEAPPKPGGSKDQNDYDQADFVDDPDGVRMDILESDDDYSDVEQSTSSSDSESELSSEGSVSREETPPRAKPSRENDSDVDQSEDELDPNDPRVKRLLSKLMKETVPEKGEPSSNRKQDNRGKGKKTIKLTTNAKSPSDTTIYVPALARNTMVGGTPTGFLNDHIRNATSPQVIDKISDFVEKIRLENDIGSRSERGEDRRQNRHSRSRSRSATPARRQNTTPEYTGHGNAREASDHGHRRERRSIADDIVIQAEKFKASIMPPKGNESDEQNNIGINEYNADFSRNLQEMIHLLKQQKGGDTQDTDDDFFHVTCHVDATLKAKIAKGEFVDLDRLLPKSRVQLMYGSESEIEVIKKNGASSCHQYYYSSGSL